MKNFALFLLFVITGCVSYEKKIIDDSFLTSFDLIKLGDTADFVKKKIGLPQVGQDERLNSDDFDWHYKDTEQSLIATFNFDKNTRTVQTILINPLEKEIKLDFLLNLKFKNLKFENLKKIECDKPFYLIREFYINKETGLVISNSIKSNSIEYYAFQRPEQVENLIQTFNACKMKNY